MNQSISVETFRSAIELKLSGLKSLSDSSRPVACRILRIELPLDELDLLQWLTVQADAEKIYWHDRQDSLEIAAVGVADATTSTAGDDSREQHVRTVSSRIQSTPDPIRYYGGTAFQANIDESDSDWSAFDDCHFLLPRFEIVRDNTRGTLIFACNFVVKEAEDPNEIISRLTSDFQNLRFDIGTAPTPGISARTAKRDIPTREIWADNVNHALTLIHDGALSKIVLARKTMLTFAENLDPFVLMRQIKARSQNCFHFCFQPKAGSAFIAATPERLYRRSGQSLEVEAVAGTRDRGESDELDDAIGNELSEAPKDLREHQIVIDNLRSALAELGCASPAIGAVSLLKLQNVQHLYLPMDTSLPGTVTDAELLNALHPTSAVGGHPSEQALAYINQLEKFDRGWYAGPFGWINASTAEFVVGIRSALITGNRLQAFAGAGIVDGSDPELEWAETERKLDAFVNLAR